MTGPVPLRERAALALADAEYAAAWRLLGALPAGPAFGAFRLGADLAARRGGAGAGRLRANLARVRPGASPAELDALVRAGLRSYARYWCEAFRLPRTDLRRVHDATVTGGPGLAAFHAAVRAGRGAVVALPHSGNWDASGVWLVETLRRCGAEPSFTTVAQRLRPDSLYRRFAAYRARLGFEVVAADDARAAHRALTRRLRAGGVVCLVADRDVTGGGIEVALFGEPARLPAGPAQLAALTGAPLFPVFAGFTPDGWSLRLASPLPVADRRGVPGATQALADAFAELIARRPQDWHALQPVWSADRPRSVP